MANRPAAATVAVLGTAQTLAWASSYYLPAMLALPMARDLGVSTPSVFAAFSGALLVSAAIGPRAGRSIDRLGGCPVLIGTNLVFALGLVCLGIARGPLGLCIGWAIMGVGMGCGLYEAAFAALVRLYGHEARGAITGITLIAGFASTVGWPLSAFLESRYGWRGACFGWATLHLILGVPLNASLPKATLAAGTLHAATRIPLSSPPMAVLDGTRMTILLASVFAAMLFVSTAMATHLPGLLAARGVGFSSAVALGALVGPAQVAARLFEFGFLRRVHPLVAARLAAVLHPLGAVALIILGAPAAALFVVLHGAGNGILTIAKGTLPLVLFGPEGYGQRQGMLTVPARFAQAGAPWLFGLGLERWGGGALWVSITFGLVALVALFALPTQRPGESIAESAAMRSTA